MSRTPKPIRIEGDVAYVPLTKGYEALIDSEDVHIVDRLSWRAMVRGGIVYAIAADGQKTVYMHRVIMGADRGVFVDHADHDGLNNRRANMRLATPSQNCFNRRMRSNNTSGFKGVHWSKKAQKWCARIVGSGTDRFCGYHDTPEAAHAAYCKASAELHGEFGHTG
jgi:hypothetical protein